jgi:hypothetical protein
MQQIVRSATGNLPETGSSGSGSSISIGRKDRIWMGQHMPGEAIGKGRLAYALWALDQNSVVHAPER